MPEISIVIACYNCEKYLAACLDSVLGQTFEDWEAIVVDDGSTDGSSAILSRYAERDTRIKVVDQPNRGQSAARNRALQLASGRYVCFLDADDFYDAGFLSDLLREARRTDADVVMTNTRYVGGDKPGRTRFEPRILTRFSEKVGILPHGGIWDKIYRMSLIRDNRLAFPEGLYYEDNIFVVRALFHSDRFAVTNGANYNYRYNPNSTLHDDEKARKRMEDGIAVAKMIMNFAAERFCSEEDRRILSDFCLKNILNVGKMETADFLEVKNLLCQTPLMERLTKKRARQILKRKIFDFLRLRGGVKCLESDARLSKF